MVITYSLCAFTCRVLLTSATLIKFSGSHTWLALGVKIKKFSDLFWHLGCDSLFQILKIYLFVAISILNTAIKPQRGEQWTKQIFVLSKKVWHSNKIGSTNQIMFAFHLSLLLLIPLNMYMKLEHQWIPENILDLMPLAK